MVAGCGTECAKEVDTVARMGGEEFFILTGVADARETAIALNVSLKRP